MATHSPLLMAVPGARLMKVSHRPPHDARLRDTDHFTLMARFARDPEAFVRDALAGDDMA